MKFPKGFRFGQKFEMNCFSGEDIFAWGGLFAIFAE